MVCYPCFWDYFSQEYLHCGFRASTLPFEKSTRLVLGRNFDKGVGNGKESAPRSLTALAHFASVSCCQEIEGQYTYYLSK